MSSRRGGFGDEELALVLKIGHEVAERGDKLL